MFLCEGGGSGVRDQHFRLITEPSGRQTYINSRDIRSFYNFENRLLIEMIDGTNYEVTGAPAVSAFYASSFELDLREQLTFTSGAVSVANVDTLIIPANPARKFLMLQRGTTVGRTFVKFGAGAATTTNGFLMRENTVFTFDQTGIDIREVRAITVGSNKLLYWTEG